MMRYDDTVKFALPLLYGSADSDNIIPKMHQYLNNRAGITLPVSYFYGSPNTCKNHNLLRYHRIRYVTPCCNRYHPHLVGNSFPPTSRYGDKSSETFSEKRFADYGRTSW